MRPIRALFAALLLVCPLAAAELPSWRLDPRVAPVRQEITLSIDPARDDYSGSTRIEIAVSEVVSSFRLHAEEMEIRDLSLHGNGIGVPVTYEAAERGVLQVRSATPLQPGRYVLRISFANEYDTRAVGLYKVKGRPYVFTQFEAIDARKAFPCWDEPQYKIPFQLTVAAPAGVDVVTNTPASSTSEEGGTRTIAFQQTKPLPTYLLAIAAGKFDSVPIEGMGVPGRVYGVEGTAGQLGTAAREIPRILAAQEEWFGIAYPYSKLDFIAVPEYWPGAMEHPGLITFAENLMLVDEGRATMGEKRSLMKVISHELAHQWFGNLVTMQWWDDLWLNESFADWFGDKIADRIYPEYDVRASELGGIQNILTLDARPTTDPIRSEAVTPESVLNQVGLAYNKGKAVLAMFEQWVGEEAFRRGVVRYIRDNAWGNATAEDLWAALAQEGKSQVPDALRTFIVQSGYPLIEVEPAGEGRVRISQRRFLNAGVEAPGRVWSVPVALRYSAGKESGEVTLLLDEPSETFSLAAGEIDWVYPHADAVGYYRWTVPAPMMQELAAAAPARLTVEERIAFSGNLAALLEAGAIRGDEYLRVIERFAADPDPRVVASLLPRIGRIEAAFATPELEPAFRAWMRRTLRPAFERFGFTPRAGEDPTLTHVRAQLIETLGGAGRDPEVLAWASRAARSYMADRSSLDPSLVPAALGIAALEGDRALFDAYRARFESGDPADRALFLDAMGEFEDPAIRSAALEYALKGPVRSNEMMHIPFGMTGDAAGRERIFIWVTEEWDEVLKRLPPAARAFMPQLAAGCEEEMLAKARAFFTAPERRNPGSDRTLARVTEQVNDCVRLRNREKERVAAALR